MPGVDCVESRCPLALTVQLVGVAGLWLVFGTQAQPGSHAAMAQLPLLSPAARRQMFGPCGRAQGVAPAHWPQWFGSMS